DTDNYEWSNGTVAPVEYAFEIGKAKVELPAESDSVFVYNGKVQTYELPENPLYIVAGNVQTKVGKYTVSISLTDTDNYEWSNGTVAPVEYAFEIGKAKIEIPAKLDSVFVYNGKEQTYEMPENPLYIVAGNVQTKVGKYTVSVSLVDSDNYEWSNGTVTPVEYSFEIGKAKVEIPAELDSVFVYNGKEQTYELPENPLYAVAGNVQTEIGVYSVWVSLVDKVNYVWSDSSDADLSYEFVINNPAKDTIIIVIPDVVPEFKDTIVSKDSVILYDKGGIYVYDIKFDSLAHEAGFVDLEQIPGNKGIRFSIPKDATPGTYSATLIITYSDGSVEEKPFTFTVPKPKEKDVHSPLDVVLSVNPARQNEQFKVMITGDISEVDMASSTLAVYNMIGQILYYKKGVDRNNMLTLDYNGVCIVVVDFGDWYESKRLMVK
ncbi:MAG: hypothetical protein KBT22_11365, partial [Bacteroidales bacterium]|nr:hypothetical protein [Candidatus Scybalocola fimicaballi]